MDGATSHESSFVNNNNPGTILLMDSSLRTDRRAIVSEVPANIKANLSGNNQIIVGQDKKGLFNNTMGPL